MHYRADVAVDQDGALLQPTHGSCLSQIDAGVGGLRILRGHLPERILDDDRGVVAYAQLPKEELLSLAGAEKILVLLRCGVPALVLYKGESHRRFMAMGLPQ